MNKQSKPKVWVARDANGAFAGVEYLYRNEPKLIDANGYKFFVARSAHGRSYMNALSGKPFGLKPGECYRVRLEKVKK